MTAVALVLAAVAALLHVYIWTLESLTWRSPRTWKTFGLASQADADTTAPMAFNQGFYNLFLAAGTALGIIHVAGSHDTVGWTLIFFGCGSMLAASVVLASTGKKYLRGAVVQGLVPLLTVIAALIAAN